MRVRKSLALAVKVIASAGLLSLAVRDIDWAAAGDALRDLDPTWVLLAPVVMLLAQLVSGIRWHLLLHAHGVDIPLRRSVALTLVSSFFNSGLPSTFGGDAARVYYAAKNGGALPEVAATTLLDRFAGLTCVTLAALMVTTVSDLSGTFGPVWRGVCLTLSIGVLVAFVGLALINHVPRPKFLAGTLGPATNWKVVLLKALAGIAAIRFSVGATALATAVLSEAADLRSAGIAAPILVLGHLPPWQAREAVRLGVAVTVFDDEAAHHLSDAAVAVGRTVPVHVKVDTGLRRIGLEPADVVPFGRRLAALRGIKVEGLYTHLATADAADQSFAREQLARFNRVIDAWYGSGLPRPRWVHAANSAAAVHLPEARFDLVRPGIALHGIAPSAEATLPAGFRAAMQLKTRIAQVKHVRLGEAVSYGRTWVAPTDTLIGVLPIGYGDGLRRGPQTWGGALVRGRRVPFVGRICMDMCMVDVTGIPGVRAGDHAVLDADVESAGSGLHRDEAAAHHGVEHGHSWFGVVDEVGGRVIARNAVASEARADFRALTTWQTATSAAALRNIAACSRLHPRSVQTSASRSSRASRTASSRSAPSPIATVCSRVATRGRASGQSRTTRQVATTVPSTSTPVRQASPSPWRACRSPT